MHTAKQPAVLLKGASGSLRAFLCFIGFGLLYLVLARASLWLVYQPAGVVSIWLPSGLALAMLLLARRRSWPMAISIVLIANTCANLLSNNALMVSLVLALSNCIEASLIVSLLVRFGRLAPDKTVSFQHAPDVLAFGGIIFSGSGIAAMLMAAAVVLSPGTSFWKVWFSGWIADGLGIALLTPLILVWLPVHSGKPQATIRGRRGPVVILEAVVLVGSAALVAWSLFLSKQTGLFISPLRAYLLFPLMAWAGLRFNLRYVTGLLASIGLCAILGTLNGLGQFAQQWQAPDQRLLVVQLYLVVLVSTTYVLSAAFNETRLMGELLARSETEYRNLFQSASIGIFHARPDGGFIRVNAIMAAMFGYSSPQEMVSAITDTGTQLHLDPLRYAQLLEKTCKQGSWVHVEGNCQRKDGSLMMGRLSARGVPAQDGSLAYLEGFVEDVTERKHAEDALKKSETLLNETQALSKVGGWEYDRASRQMIWTREVYRIYGVPEDHSPIDLSRDLSSYLPEDRPVIEKAFCQALIAGKPFDLELRFINAQGIHLWLHSCGNPVIVDGKVVKVTGNIMDVTANKLVEATLRRVNERLEQQLAENEVLQALLLEQSVRDSLTGLYNRRYMDDTLERELARASRGAYPISVMMIDIDLFKSFNDCHGHATGDRVLMVLGSLLRAAVRESDVACRYGGEEFVVILPGAGLEDALQRAENIRQGFGSIRVEECSLTPTISVGVAEYPRHGTSGDELLRAADTALYAAKAGGRNCVREA